MHTVLLMIILVSTPSTERYRYLHNDASEHVSSCDIVWYIEAFIVA